MASKLLKSIAAALAIFLLIGIAGCSGGTSDENSSDSSESGEAEPARVVKVGYILNDDGEKGGFSGQANEQRVKAARRCGVETVYIDNVTVGSFEAAVKALVSAGCTDIVSCSPVFTNMLNSISSKYMNVNFINFGQTGMGTANTFGYTETAYQGAYAAGMAAAYNSETQKIGMVADPELFYNYATINAAALATRFVFANSTLCVAYATRDDEIREAVNALKAADCDVVICYTESPYTGEYCEQQGIKFIGNLDYSGKEENYKNLLMYFYSKRDSFFVSQFKQMKLDTWETDLYTGTMANGIINVSAVSENAAKEKTQDIIDELIPRLTSGQIYIFSGELKDMKGNIKYMQTETMSEAQVLNMDWYVLGVEITGNFRKIKESDTIKEFVIKS